MVSAKHLIIDANDCQGDITNREYIQKFINHLCELGKMEKIGETIFEYYEDTPFNRQNDLIGYSVVQIISISNITIHINFLSKTLYFDFFTCGALKTDLIHSLFLNYFHPKTIKKIILQRDAVNHKLPFIN